MTRWISRPVIIVALAMLCASRPGFSQSNPGRRGSIVIVTGQLGTLPIPTLIEGPAASVSNLELADQLFLRLAGLGPTLLTAGDRGFVPLLARSWTRRDSLTLVFDLDPRARWHDGTPVTSKDVVFTIKRAKDPAIAPRLADLLRRIESVSAEGIRRVVFRYTEPYAEQFYDATFHVAPLPAHLLDSLAPEAVARSSFVTQPVGSGPYRMARSVAGQFVELVANHKFFLGRPKLERVIFRAAADPEARLNLLLSGEADAIDNVVPPLENIRRINADPTLRIIPVPSPTVGFLLFNQRDPRDTARSHPVLADIRVRRAIILGLDRQLMARAVFGPYGVVPYGPVSPILWIRHHAPRAERQNLAEARRLLAAAGWRDSDGDGTLERSGQPLTLTLSLPNTSAIRRQFSLLVQEQLRQLGIKLDLQQLDFPVYLERRSSGRFDIDFAGTSQDPSPSGLTQGWTCAGGTNVAKYCNPRTDSLLDQAILARGGKDPAQLWVAVLRQIEADAPAAFLYAPSYVYSVRRRFLNVAISPTSSWQLIRTWSDGT
ncbi:MAG TPA: ABC transporter substrate-binding protein [Gemmatimonadales bacterium]|nr:ABC transporter substrate-binding protein [Gemmatimonadales bacterium]